ncbi:hypothetical protein L6472_06185 [Prevotella sp. E13-17]|uniref:putative polyvalent protein kinase domain-containing protein n=1 Tax=Prevotella sp. E13-17 TaxID=2913616 RepID=UPI001EDC3729|nr:JAB domain-containing protein [Prevotella sp. E13-17]UKK52167.1 hypothetical protein L6472_06185 [Prevotella sp. E13-17]
MKNESREWLYNELTKNGYNVGKDYDEFDSLMDANKESREWAYKTAQQHGYNVGATYDEFEKLIAPKPELPNPEQIKTAQNIAAASVNPEAHEKTVQQPQQAPSMEFTEAQIDSMAQDPSLEHPQQQEVPWSQQTITDDLPDNPYAGMTRQEAINTLGEKYFYQWYGKNPRAYQSIKEEAAKYNFGSPEEINQIPAMVRNTYIPMVAKKRAEDIIKKAGNEYGLSAAINTRNMREAIADDQKNLGLVKEDADAYYGALRDAIEQQLGEGRSMPESSKKALAQLVKDVTPRSSQEHLENVERAEVTDLIGNSLSASINNALDAAEAYKKAKLDALQTNQPKFHGQFNTTGDAYLINEEEPEKILEGLKANMQGAATTILQDSKTFDEIWKRANDAGYDINDYLNKFVAPVMEEALERRFMTEAVKRKLPKSTIDYVMKGLTEDNIAAMLFNYATRSDMANRIAVQADMDTQEGKNPYYTPGTGAQLTRMGVSFAADAPFFGLYGRVSGAVAKQAIESQVKKFIAKGMSEGAARNLVNIALDKSVGYRMRTYLMQNIISSSTTLGGYNLTSEVARQLRDNDQNIMNVFGSFAEGLFSGAAFGVTGAVSSALAKPLTGVYKIGAGVAGYLAEAETMYTTEELAKMMHGRETFDSPLEGSAEAVMKLGVIKLSGGHMLKKIYDTLGNISEKGLKDTFNGLLGKNYQGMPFSDQEVSYIINSTNGKNLIDALTNMHPDIAFDEFNGKKKFSKQGEVMRLNLADKYDTFMEDAEIPASLKQKVAKVFGGYYKPGLEVTTDIEHNADGTVLLKTRDKDGNCIQELPFDSFSEADEWRSIHQDEMTMNDAVNTWSEMNDGQRAEAIVQLADDLGIDLKEATMYVSKALDPTNSELDRDIYNKVFDTITRNAYPTDQLDTQRRYFEGRKMTPEERHYAKVDLQVAEEALDTFGEDFSEEVIAGADNPEETIVKLASRREVTGPQIVAAVNYYNCRAKVNGIIEGAVADIDNKVAASNAYIKKNTHPDTGYLIEASAEDGDYYITAGHFQLDADGRIVPTDNTGMVIMRNKQTGEISVMHPSRVTVTGIHDPQKLIDANDSMKGLRGELIQEADKSIDINPEAPETPQEMGETFTGADGKQYVVTGTQNEDGTITWAKVEIDAEGNPIGEVMPLDLAEYRQAKSDMLDAASREQIETSLEQALAETPATETPAEEQPMAITEPIADDNKVEEADSKASPQSETGANELPATTSRIPVDEKGHKLYEQAKPEDTLAELTAKHGEEKAQRMIKQIAEASEKQAEELRNQDTSAITDMEELDAHEEAVAAAEAKAQYWKGLISNNEQKPINNGQLPDGWSLSEKRAKNGEQFYQDANGNIDLVDIPQEVLDKIGYTKAPLRLTPSMLKHVQMRHGKETKITNEKEAILFITDVVKNFDHIRLGNDGALIFSIENGREKTGKRAITILLGSDNGDYYGIKTSGYESVERLNKRPVLWEGSAIITPSTDSATEPVTTRDAQQGGEQIGSAPGQSGLPVGKDREKDDTIQENSVKNASQEQKTPQQPTGITPKKAKIYIGSVDSNTGRTFSYTDQQGKRTEITIKSTVLHDGQVSVMRQDYDANGQPIGEAREVKYPAVKIGEGIINGSWKKELTTEEKLREAMKKRIGADRVINVLTEKEIDDLWQAYDNADGEAFENMYNTYRQEHFEDLIRQMQDDRISDVEKILASGARTKKLKDLRKIYEGYNTTIDVFSDESMQPQSLEEFVADYLGDVPKPGEGTIAYYTYGEGDSRVVGLQDETGFSNRSFGGDIKGFNPWLAPKGKGISIQRMAERIHEDLSESMKEQYSDQDVRNALLEVLTSAQKPSDIANYILRNRAELAEQAARREEDNWVEAGVSYQKVEESRRFSARLQKAVNETNTEPSEAQKEAGNYKKGHLSFGGYHYTIENPAGGKRRGTDANGKAWESEMKHTYGYILGKKGKDGDHLDMFINDKADLDNWNGTVYVVDQIDPETGKFDEHKVMYGFGSEAEAREAYLANYEKGWKGLGKITGVDKETFDKWLDSSDRKVKEFADHSIVQHKVESQVKNFDGAIKALDEREISIDDPTLMEKYGLTHVTLSRTGDHVTLTDFIVDERGQGNGTRFMEDLTRLADEKGWTLALTPDTSFGASSISRLKKFYKRFGLKDNKGRNTDFYTRESMVRRPKDWMPNSPEQQEQALRDHVVDYLKSKGIEVSDDWKEGQRILDRFNGEQIKMQKVYHGSGADFDVFDHSHMGEGAASQSFGWGTYVSTRQKVAEGYLNVRSGIKHYHNGNEIAKDDKVHRMAAEVWESSNNREEAISLAERFQKSQANNSERIELWNRVIDIIKTSEKEDYSITKSEPTLYTVDIPDDKEAYYIDYKGKMGAQKDTLEMVDNALAADGWKRQEIDSRVKFTKDGKQIILTENQSGADLYAELQEALGSEKAASEFLNKVGITGIKFPAGTIYGGGDGATNYVIFNEADAKITNKMKFFKTSDGQAYGFTWNGKIYVDPRIATAETPVHEYGHLWIQAVRKNSPKEWEYIKDIVLNDKLVQPIIDKVRAEYPELTTEGKEDDFMEEVITQFSGKRGAERLREIANEVAAENGGVFGKAEAVTAMQRLKNIINRFWEGVAHIMGWHYTNANQIADRIMADMLNGVDPQAKAKRVALQKAPIFISNAMKAVEDIKQEKGTADQWLAMIKKNGGLKAGEDKWLGLSDFLNEHKNDKLTKEEVMNFIKSNQIQIEETHYTEGMPEDAQKKLDQFNQEFEELILEGEEETNSIYTSDWVDWAYNQMVDRYGDDFRDAFELGEGTGTDTRLTPLLNWNGELSDQAKDFLGMGVYGDENSINSRRLSYTTEGLDNKREIALTVPNIEPYNQFDEIHFGDAGGGRAIAWVRFGDATAYNHREKSGQEIEDAKDAVRKSIPDAQDWRKWGKEDGYRDILYTPYEGKPNRTYIVDKSELAKQRGIENGFTLFINEKLISAHKTLEDAVEAYKNDVADKEVTSGEDIPQKVLVIDEIQSKRHQDGREKGYTNKTNDWMIGKAVPDAPFEKNWHELAMKRMLRYAAENDYDKVAWTTGKQQAERYKIGQVVEQIIWENTKDGKKIDIDAKNTSAGQAYRFVVDGDGRIVRNLTRYNLHESELVGKPLSDLVGKELASKIMSDDGEEVKLPRFSYYKLSGDGLHIGGKGMKGFYDEILPSFMNKYGKKWGVKVEEVNLPELEESARKMWSVDVTPEMKESVMQGQPMFQKAHENNLGNSYKLGDNFISLQSDADREAVDKQKATMPKTATWRDGMEDVVIHTTLSTIKKKYADLHAKAKAGSIEAADELVAAIVKPAKVKALVEKYPNAKVAFVHAEEATGYNQIPGQYALEFEDAGLQLSDIVQINKPAHTGSDRVGRFLRRARFDGNVEPGAEYIIVDDHVTMGGTLRDLKDYIESEGGKVVAVSTLTASAGGTKLKPTDEQIEQLNNKGVTNEQLRELGIADSPEGLTRSEAKEILVLADGRGNQVTSRGRSEITGDREAAKAEAQGEAGIESASEAAVIPLSRSNEFGLNQNDPVGQRLSVIKAQGGNNTIGCYHDTTTDNFIFFGNDADTVAKITRIGSSSNQRGMESLEISSNDFDRVMPMLVRNGLRVGIIDKDSLSKAEISIQPRHPKVRSAVQGELFPDMNQKEGTLNFLEDAQAAKVVTIKQKPVDLKTLSDDELLGGMETNTSRDKDFFIDEYDSRHREEYNKFVDSYTEMLEKESTSLEDAYGMYAEVSKKWNEGGYKSAERSRLMAQIDALEDYVERLESEKIDEEMRNEDEQLEEDKQRAADYQQQKEDVRSHGYDLTKLKMRELSENESCLVERHYTENNSFSFTGDERIESAADVAYIFRELENSAVENAFMVLIKDGQPTVIHLGIGAYNGVAAPIEQTFVAVEKIKPDSVVFLHNHPSGNLIPSKQDIDLQEKVVEIFRDKARPAIIINTKSGKYAEYMSGGTQWESEEKKLTHAEIPVKVFNFSQQVFDKDWNPETAFKGATSNDIAAFVSSHRLGEHDKLSLIVTDTAGHITGNIFLPWTKMEDACKPENAQLIASYVNQMGGIRCVVYGSYGSEGRKTDEAINKLSRLLRRRNVNMIDAINIDRSAYFSGVFEPDNAPMFQKKDSERRAKRVKINSTIEQALSFVTGRDLKDIHRERQERETDRKHLAKKIYENVLSGDINDVTLQQINNYIDDVTPFNPYGRRLSERLPQRVERSLYGRERKGKIDALYSRISESAIPANERTRPSGRRAIEERKKELLEQWAKATGNWHTDINDFVSDTKPIGSGTDSDVYASKDSNYVIKLSHGKPEGKRFRPDIDNIPLFNYLFPNSAYDILGYGDFGKGFVRILKQPAVDFANSQPLSVDERVEFMKNIGFNPINDKKTAFSNGEIIVADLQKSNVVKDANGNIRVIDADCKLHTRDLGGQYDYLPVEHDFPDTNVPTFQKVAETYDEAMAEWKKANNIPENATGPMEKPQFRPGENALDFAKRLTEWRKSRSLWDTAPKAEAYERKAEDNADVEEALERERQYPDSESFKRARIAAEMKRIRHAMSDQKQYDKATVKAVTDFTQDFMKMGFGDNLGRSEMERMLSSVKNATGAKTVKQSVDNIMNILVNNQLRNLDAQVTKLSSIKELRLTAQGVEHQGKLELKGQRMIQSFREARQERLTADEIRERLYNVSEKMTAGGEEAEMYEQEYEGLSIALQYADNIDASRKDWAELDREYKEALKNYRASGRTYKEQQEYLDSLEKAMMENKIERIGMYGDIIGRLQGNIDESLKGAKEFRDREKKRVEMIHSLADSDLSGKEGGAMRMDNRGKTANFFLQPLATFEQMLKQFGANYATGEGRLYDYFMRTYMDATDKAYIGEERAKEELDAKAREVFGDKVQRWSDLYNIVRRLPMMDVDMIDGYERKTFKLTQGNLLYIYMANKMSDGQMKLKKMGITEDVVEGIKDFLDPRLVELGDWLQEEYLPEKRKAYNKVHERMFGAPMAAIDHYFPIKVLGDARVQEQDVNVPDSDTLPSTITGNIIKRRKNTLPLDILHTDALSLAIEHAEDMERWAATAEFNKDVNTLLSYTTFRNKVKNMKTIYGSGDALWNTFKDTARMAAGVYKPKVKRGSADAAINNIAKGVTQAKIAFRGFTAFKQILSAPAFLHDVDLADFAKYSVNPYGSWKWAMENMPVFRKRWKSRQAGDTRLMEDPTDWKMWKNDIVQLASRMGMSPNALVDGVTCAVGARAIFESRYKKYLEYGATEEMARKRALQDAEIGYNLTQQSSDGAFVSAIQKDRTTMANMLSIFRNSSMAYTRQWVDASRNLKHRMQKGYKQDAILYMTAKYKDELGLDDNQARRAAELEYAKAGRHEVAKMLNMMFGVTIAWNLGASLPYLLIGDDDETKKEMLTDAAIRGFVAGPIEGFAAGNIISEIISRSIASEETRKTLKADGWGAAVDAAIKQAGDYEINPLPFMADIQGMISKMGYDKFAAAQDLFNICVQSGVGVNPQTFTDMWNACMDYGAPAWDGTSKLDTENMQRPKEIALFIMRLMNAPTSSWRNKYIDELGMNAEDAQKLPYEEMAKRYAHYKHWKDAPVMGWLRDEETRNAKIEKIQEQFDDAVIERMERLTDKELMHNVARSSSLDERRMYAKVIHSRLGLSTSSVDGKKATKYPYQQEYQRLMQYDDIKEDELLFNGKDSITDEDTKKRIDQLMDWIRDGRYATPSGRASKTKPVMEVGKKQLIDADEETRQEAMENIRRWRKEALELMMRSN